MLAKSVGRSDYVGAMPQDSLSQPSDRPTVWERAAAVAVACEALAVLGWATATFAFDRAGAVERGDTSGFIVVFAAVAAVGLGIVARGLWAGARWARGPALAWQALQVGIGLANVLINPAAGIGLTVLGLVVLAGVWSAIRRTGVAR